MAVALIALGAFLATLPALCNRAGRRLRPAEWSRLSAGGLIAGATIVEVGLALLAVPTVLRSFGIDALAEACIRVVGPLVPFGDSGGWAAAAVLVATVGLGLRGLLRARASMKRVWIEQLVGTHQLADDGIDIVVLPTHRTVAYSVHAPTRQIVVSEGLAAACCADEFDVVVAHERAHLVLGHHRVLGWAAAAKAALAWWPPTIRSHQVVCVALERWADETATSGQQSRRSRLGNVLARIATEPTPPAVPALSAKSMTAERIAALSVPAPPIRPLYRLLYVPGGAAGLAAVFAFSVWLSQAQFVLALAGRCPFTS